MFLIDCWFRNTVFQSVLSALGAPSKVFYTKADRMLIHRGEDSEKLRGPRPNYFFNYFSLGVVSDTLISLFRPYFIKIEQLKKFCSRVYEIRCCDSGCLF